jgi:hypothetical protein
MLLSGDLEPVSLQVYFQLHMNFKHKSLVPGNLMFHGPLISSWAPA